MSNRRTKFAKEDCHRSVAEVGAEIVADTRKHTRTSAQADTDTDTHTDRLSPAHARTHAHIIPIPKLMPAPRIAQLSMYLSAQRYSRR